MRSLYYCAPWLRTIHLVVSDYQKLRRFLKGNVQAVGPRIRVVRHSEFMPRSALPTFNSQALEAKIDEIPNLAEHFIYCNDDFFLGKPLSPTYFFTKDGRPRYNLDRSHVPHRRKTRNMSMHAKAWCNNSRILDSEFGFSSRGRQYPSHVAVPMLRSTWKESRRMSDRIRLELDITAKSPFRVSNNIYAIGLFVYWNLYTMKAIRRMNNDTFFHDLEPGDLTGRLFHFIWKSQPSLYCINDCDYGSKERNAFLRAQRSMFPLQAPWEPRGIELPKPPGSSGPHRRFAHRSYGHR